MTEPMDVHDVEGSNVISIPGQLRYNVQGYGNNWRIGNEEASFRSWADSSEFDENLVYRISQDFDNEILDLVVTQWDPHTCQGRSFPTFSFSYGPSPDIFWSRSPAAVPDSFWKDKNDPLLLAVSKKQSLNDAFDTIILKAKLNRLEIEKMSDEVAYEVLYPKLLHHPTITKLDIPSAEYCKEALVDFCCNLIANSDTLEEVFFQDIGSLDEIMVKKLFDSVNTSPSLKVLDLRTSRYLETWDKSGMRSTLPVIPVETILASFESFDDSPCSLQTLDFGGNAMAASSPVCPLVTKLLSPSLGLQRLSFRGCALTEAGLLAVAKELEDNHCLEFLDLSHNVMTKPVMQQLAKSLAKNTTLRKLKMEHCKIDLEIAECLAYALPVMQGLRHLHMDGNEFTWEPLTETGESIGAIAILEALETNKSLFSLEMGEHGKVLRLLVEICCTSPSYSTTLCKEKLEEMGAYLARNEIEWEELKESRSQKAVVSIVKILLSKTC